MVHPVLQTSRGSKGVNMGMSTDALFYYGINIAHEEDGDYPEEFTDLDPEADFLAWFEDRVKSFNEKHGTTFDVTRHCCNNCTGYAISMGEGYDHRAWRGSPCKISGLMPSVGDENRGKLIEFALSMGVEDPATKMGWWLASFAEM